MIGFVRIVILDSYNLFSSCQVLDIISQDSHFQISQARVFTERESTGISEEMTAAARCFQYYFFQSPFEENEI